MKKNNNNFYPHKIWSFWSHGGGVFGPLKNKFWPKLHYPDFRIVQMVQNHIFLAPKRHFSAVNSNQKHYQIKPMARFTIPGSHYGRLLSFRRQDISQNPLAFPQTRAVNHDGNYLKPTQSTGFSGQFPCLKKQLKTIDQSGSNIIMITALPCN